MSGNMTGVLHCPDCKKMIASRVALVEGSHFIMKCYSCKGYVKIIVGFNYIDKKMLKNINDNSVVMFTAE